MVQITSYEAQAIRKKIPGISIRRTVNKFYMEESRQAMRMLSRIRNEGVVETYGAGRKGRGR